MPVPYSPSEGANHVPPRKKQTTAPERVSGLLDAKDRREAIEVFGRAFANPAWMESHVAEGLFQGPLFRREHTRVVVADGRVAAGVVMGPRTLRFGPARVPAMTIGPVGTHDAMRKRGWAAAAMDDASRYMAENGILLAYLCGIPDFYYRFGYYPFMADATVVIRRDAAKKESLPGHLRAMRRKDLPAVRRLYDAVSAERPCAAARDKPVWDWLIGPATRTWIFRKPRVILDGRGRLCGYVTRDMTGPWTPLGELVVRQDERSCRTALGALVKEARRLETREMVLPLPYDDALAVFARQFTGAEFKMLWKATGGHLMKVVDFPALMQRLQPLFERRWKDARTTLPGARFTLESKGGKVGIAFGPDGVSVGAPAGARRVVIPERWLSGLLSGYYSVGQVAPRKGAKIPKELAPVMDVFFPSGWPFAYQGDRY